MSSMFNQNPYDEVMQTSHKFEVPAGQTLLLKVSKPVLIEWPKWERCIRWGDSEIWPESSYVDFEKNVRIYRFIPYLKNKQEYSIRIKNTIVSHLYRITVLTGLKAQIAGGLFSGGVGMITENADTTFTGGPSSGDPCTC